MSTADNYRTARAAGTVLTASGQTGPIHVNDDTDMSPQLVIADITAISTGASIQFGIQWDADPDSATYPPATWGASVTGAPQTTTGTGITVVSATPVRDPWGGNGNIPRHFRITWALSGTTPSVTLGIYCT